MAPSRGIIISIFMRLMSVARYRFILELTLIFVTVWVGCALALHYFEIGINPLVHNPLETIYYLLVTMTTSGDSAVRPLTPGGRLVMSFALILSKLLTALLCALAAAVLIDRRLKEEMGIKMHNLENHILIVGWNLKGAQIVSVLRKDPNYHATPIVVLADVDQKPIDDPLMHFTRSMGYPIRGESIDRACAAKAALVLILANYAERTHADSLTTVNCLVVRKLNPTARIIAELLDPSQRFYLEAAGASSIISIGDVGGFLLAEAAIGNRQAKQLLDYVAHRPKENVDDA